MLSVKTFACAAAAAILSTTAYAADLSMPMSYPASAPQGGWYLRGGMGIGMMSGGVDFLQNPLNSSNFAFDHHSYADTTFYNFGVGYEVNNWLRFDVTGEYRDKTDFNAFGQYTFGGGTFGDAYHGELKSWVFLANGYVDLGTWWCLTPFIGAGIGAADNIMDDLIDTGIGTSGGGSGRNSSKWDLAYAFYAGIDYSVTRDFKIELSYRYLNYGSVTDTVDCLGGCNPDSYRFSHLSSNDLMLGFRWDLTPSVVPVMPIKTKG